MVSVGRAVLADPFAEPGPGPSITVSPPWPDNNTKVFTYKCPGDPCVDNCVFPLSKLNCTVKVSGLGVESLIVNVFTFGVTSNFFTGTNWDANPNDWPTNVEVAVDLSGHYLEVECGGQGQVTLWITAWGLPESAQPYDPPGRTRLFLTGLFNCERCQTNTETIGNGETPVPHSLAPQTPLLGGSVINLDSAGHLVNFTVQSSLGWAVSNVPASVFLAGGQSVELYPQVTVPGGTPDWTTNLVTVTSSFSDLPDLTSSATMSVPVQTPLRFVGIHPLFPGNWRLELTGPWNAIYTVEGSTNMVNWQTAGMGQAPPGANVVYVNVSPGTGSKAQFYRARAAHR